MISEDDLFYISQRKSTYYYENTFPIWRSINDGNWKLIGDIVRSWADVTSTNLHVFIMTEKISKANTNVRRSSAYAKLADLGNSIDFIIPPIIVKIAVDSMNKSRGMAFFIANDPLMTIKQMEILIFKTPNAFCKKIISCHKTHPEFLDAKRGLTYCCSLDDSKMWADMVKLYYG